MGEQQDSFLKLETYIKQRRIAFISFIVCCVIAFICGADTFDKVSTWFWIMMTIAALILTLVINSKYNEACDEWDDKKASQHDKEIRELEKEIKAISNTINSYKLEVFQYEKENKVLKEHISALETDKVRLRGEINSLNERLRMQSKEADNSAGGLNLLSENRKLQKELEMYTSGSDKVRWENERLKCEVAGLRKLLSEKEKPASVTDKPQEEQVKKVIAVEVSEIPIDKNVDAVLD
nr:hypothetical protein [Oscillospiraceae bacterium]